MAISTSSYFSNSIIGVPQVGSDIDLYSSESSPKYVIGFGFTRADGNKYRYVHFGALTNRGTAVSKLAGETNLTKIDNVGCVLANRTTKSGEILAPNVIGSDYLQLVITATADQFAGGYIAITTGNGSGFTYRIKGNTATSSNTPVTGNIYMDLYDKVVTAIDSNSDIAISGCKYADLFPATTLTAGAATVVGVSVSNNTAGNFGWICTSGVIGTLQDINIGIYGRPVTLSTTTVGAIQAIASGSVTALVTAPLVGYLVEPGSSADYSLVKVQLE